MLGWINDCIEKLVLHKFDLTTWHAIKERAGMREYKDGGFLKLETYPLKTTTDLIQAASDLSGLAGPQVYEVRSEENRPQLEQYLRSYQNFFTRFYRHLVSSSFYTSLTRDITISFVAKVVVPGEIGCPTLTRFISIIEHVSKEHDYAKFLVRDERKRVFASILLLISLKLPGASRCGLDKRSSQVPV